MLRNIQLERNKVILLTLVVGFVALALLLYLYSERVLVPLSVLFLRHPPFFPILNEYVPIAAILLVLTWVKIERIGGGKGKLIDLHVSVLVIVFFLLIVLAVFRVWDVVAMITYPYDVDALLGRNHAEIWMNIFFYFALSGVLLGFFVLSFGLKALKSTFVIPFIPAFYTFNTNMVLYADKIPSFSVFYPIFLFVQELGRVETLAVSGLLNALNIRNTVYAQNFPYSLMIGGTRYVIGLPCIGWEGIVAYTIILVAFITELDVSYRMKIFWSVLGFLGTLLVNLLRLTIILAAGAVWGAPAAQLIHTNAGDVIFLVWILAFWFAVLWFSKRMSRPKQKRVANNSTGIGSG